MKIKLALLLGMSCLTHSVSAASWGSPRGGVLQAACMGGATVGTGVVAIGATFPVLFLATTLSAGLFGYGYHWVNRRLERTTERIGAARAELDAVNRRLEGVVGVQEETLQQLQENQHCVDAQRGLMASLRADLVSLHATYARLRAQQEREDAAIGRQQACLAELQRQEEGRERIFAELEHELDGTQQQLGTIREQVAQVETSHEGWSARLQKLLAWLRDKKEPKETKLASKETRLASSVWQDMLHKQGVTPGEMIFPKRSLVIERRPALDLESGIASHVIRDRE